MLLSYGPGAHFIDGTKGTPVKENKASTLVGSVLNLRSRDGSAWLSASVMSCRALAAAAAAFAFPAIFL